MTRIQIGQVLLGQFRVDAFLGAGGMGAVYKVWDLKRQVPLAMKVLHADLAEDPHILKRFRREANALKNLAHPNIVPFYGMYQTLDFVFLLEGYIDGPTLKEVLRRKGRLSVAEALVVLKGVSAALSYAHAHGVVHCDVKPGNIMLDSGGRVYLTDFGIVRHAESTTTTIGFAGTAAYMAPEQVRGEAVSPATDVYALGVVAYELLAGRRPFTGEEEGTTGTRAERLRMAHLNLPPPDPREFNPELPEAVSQVLLKALAKEPGERYPDAWAFFEALCQVLGKGVVDIQDRIDELGVIPSPTDTSNQKTSMTIGSSIGKRVVLAIVFWGLIAGMVTTFMRQQRRISIKTTTVSSISTSTLTPTSTPTSTLTFTPIPTSTPTFTPTPFYLDFKLLGRDIRRVARVRKSQCASVWGVPGWTLPESHPLRRGTNLGENCIYAESLYGEDCDLRTFDVYLEYNDQYVNAYGIPFEFWKGYSGAAGTIEKVLVYQHQAGEVCFRVVGRFYLFNTSNLANSSSVREVSVDALRYLMEQIVDEVR